jgi:hypothetical protein
MSNLEKLQKALDEAKKGRFTTFDNPKHKDEIIILDCDTNIINIVTIEDNLVVSSCTCTEDKPCRHMLKVSIKYKLDIAFVQKEKKKVVKRTTKAKEKDKVIKLKGKA